MSYTFSGFYNKNVSNQTEIITTSMQRVLVSRIRHSRSVGRCLLQLHKKGSAPPERKGTANHSRADVAGHQFRNMSTSTSGVEAGLEAISNLANTEAALLDGVQPSKEESPKDLSSNAAPSAPAPVPEPELPKLTPAEFRVYNELAERMDYFVRPLLVPNHSISNSSSPRSFTPVKSPPNQPSLTMYPAQPLSPNLEPPLHRV
jgi:hypothetical protein